MDFDAIVAGAGPAGSSLAGWLGRRGLKVLLLDKAAFPRDKPCGEGILPPGVSALGAMGLLDSARAWTQPLAGLRYWTSARSARAAFPAPALAARRLRLDQALKDWALGSGGVRFEESALAVEPIIDGQVVRGVVVRAPSGAQARFRAPLLVCAEGLHSLLRSRLGARLRWPRRRRMAYVGHLDFVQGLSDHVEVFLGDQGEAYLTPTPDGVSAALLCADKPGGFMKALEAFEPLRARLSGSRLLGPVRAWGPLGPEADRVHGEGFLLAGDSAGSPDPIAGEGLSLALALAEPASRIAADAVAAGGAAARLAPYAALRAGLARGAFSLSRALLAISRRAWLRERVVGNLARRPPLFGKLLDVACGRRPYSALGWRDGLRLVC